MYQTDTTDMLPRQAPLPTAAPAPEVCQPVVPEVSIVMGQQTENQQQQQSQQNKVQSYAAWKKQMLPQVVYPASERDNFKNDMQMPLNNHYRPQRPPTTTTMSTATAFSTLSNNTNVNGDCFFRRNIASAPPMFSCPPLTHTHTTRTNILPISTLNCNYTTASAYQQQRRSLDAMSTMSNGVCSTSTPPSRPTTAASNDGMDVLTICASTQTESQCLESEVQFATKSDMQQLLATVQKMQEDQMRLMQICEIIFLQQQEQQQQPTQSFTVQKSDATTQYEHEAEEKTCNQTRNKQLNGVVALPVSQFQSPRPIPAAQSTAYQTNTPTGILRQRSVPQPKATDKTLTMNELALKYLPNDKLHELLHDMQLSAPRNPIMERVLVAAKGPTDISNASYKYLKKYRLLPEEQNNAANTPKNNYMLRAESPNQQQHSPYEQRATDSPILLRNSSSDDNDENVENYDLLNLEELRNKPKFL